MVRKARPFTLSFRCYRLVPFVEAGEQAFETVELCEPRKMMRAIARALA